ncbi:putative lipoprotein [Myxococcus stipitatus DSM 14675]|uniref:Putative lipoprotein n=1 Tax=Myxococcus stipitatus (strain DSM 14675 / JCM 12634 / Mx s8) TaxID=1278073 RepID=L7UAP9_MYXSD|nr:endonuclease/exonuclease/phosphatase family protein [Myxococcus stipitatus]AGC45153.1 putative lipoprotein [Myxococcus stipitatus DSM 14675]
MTRNSLSHVPSRPPRPSAASWAGMLSLLLLASACIELEGPKLAELELSPTSVGMDYEAVVTATGGKPPLHYTLTPPPGFSVVTSGEARLIGPASEPGNFQVIVHVRDADGSSDTASYPLKVFPRLEAGNTEVTDLYVGTLFSHTFTATGGKPPFNWSVTSGELPRGLALDTSGTLTGLPEVHGFHELTLQLKDSLGAKVDVPLRLVVLPSDGHPRVPVSVGNWNIEWFGDMANGPADDALQLTNVQKVLSDANVDIWGLVEVVNSEHFDNLKARLPDYDGFLADDSRVADGALHYSPFAQKVGVLFKKNQVQVLGAEVILADVKYLFAFRPPLRLDLRVQRQGNAVDMTVIVLHMKAATTGTDYLRRADASIALKNYLDTTLPTDRVIVLGDWNDDVDTSIVVNPATAQFFASPYANFVVDAADYRFTTEPFSLAGVSSTTTYRDFIDHQLISHELELDYLPSSTEVVRPAIPNYRTSTSDHYPIISRFEMSAP